VADFNQGDALSCIQHKECLSVSRHSDHETKLVEQLVDKQEVTADPQVKDKSVEEVTEEDDSYADLILQLRLGVEEELAQANNKLPPPPPAVKETIGNLFMPSVFQGSPRQLSA